MSKVQDFWRILHGKLDLDRSENYHYYYLDSIYLQMPAWLIVYRKGIC